jgi:hypothetical protein
MDSISESIVECKVPSKVKMADLRLGPLDMATDLGVGEDLGLIGLGDGLGGGRRGRPLMIVSLMSNGRLGSRDSMIFKLSGVNGIFCAALVIVWA